MSRISDTDYLRSHQYCNSSKLERRIALHTLFSVNPQGWQRWVFNQVSFPQHVCLLELGCGSGALWQDNLERIPTDCKIFLSDVSPGMASQAKKNLLNRIPSAHFLTINAQAIPFPKASLDAVIANHMLYHVPERHQTLAEIRRVLQPDGRLFATTVGEHHLVELYELVRRFDSELAADGWYLEPIDFTLENGQAQLAAWFKSIQLRRYEDALIITQAAPLVDYILSTVRLQLDEKRRLDLFQYIQTQIEANGGAIYITKDSGMFIASV